MNPPPEDPAGKASVEALLYRYHPGTFLPGGVPTMGQARYTYSLRNSRTPLVDKMGLFWHQVFATGNAKVDNCNLVLDQIDMFRKYGMGNYRELLVQLAKNPAMIFWLDNNEKSPGRRVNENWGRELLELFSMGVNNYTETDVREASRAFTGWTVPPKMPRLPYGRFPLGLRLPGGGPRRHGENLPGAYRQLQRRGHHRHSGQAAGDFQVHLPPPVQLLCGG